MGQRFARLYPQQARQVEWASQGSADPHVERLLESFAFLTGRLQRSLDLEFPQITSGLLGVLYPHLVSPIPSMSIACFSGKNSEGKYQFGGVPRHSELLAQPGGGLNCRFRTCYDAVALPMEVSAGFASRNDYEFLDREARVFGVISLKIAPARGIKVTLAEMQKAVRNRLRFYLNGNTSLVQTVYELLFCHVLKVAVIGEDRAPVFLPSDSIRPVGFALDEEVIPYPTESHPGYRLIQEYFALPEKFLFFDLMNLDSADRPMAGKEVEVLFLLDQAPPPGTYLAPDTFLTGCTPIINLFQTTTDPIRLDHRKSEYRLVADVRRERTMEIHSIQSGSASRDPRFQNTTISPFFSVTARQGGELFWYSPPHLCPRRYARNGYLSLVSGSSFQKQRASGADRVRARAVHQPRAGARTGRADGAEDGEDPALGQNADEAHAARLAAAGRANHLGAGLEPRAELSVVFQRQGKPAGAQGDAQALQLRRPHRGPAKGGLDPRYELPAHRAPHARRCMAGLLPGDGSLPGLRRQRPPRQRRVSAGLGAAALLRAVCLYQFVRKDGDTAALAARQGRVVEGMGAGGGRSAVVVELFIPNEGRPLPGEKF